jgi:uncharacterized protein (TIGR03086 family)
MREDAGVPTSTPSLGQALIASRRSMDDVLALITPGNRDRPSPCAGWTVYDVANHVVGGAVRYRMLLDGASAAEVEEARDGDHLRPDPVTAARRAGDALFAAATGDLRRTVHHRGGDRTAEDLLVMRVFEQTLHGWDMATGLGVQPGLDPGVCGFLLGRLDILHDGRDRGMYAAPRGTGTRAATPCVRLLVESGRA